MTTSLSDFFHWLKNTSNQLLIIWASSQCMRNLQYTLSIYLFWIMQYGPLSFYGTFLCQYLSHLI